MAKLTDFNTKAAPETGDFVYMAEPAGLPYEERKVPIEQIAGIANPFGDVQGGYFFKRVVYSGPITVSGWYTIAETSTTNFRGCAADFMVSYGLGYLGCRAGHVGKSGSTDAAQVFCELLDPGDGDNGGAANAQSFRLGFDDSNDVQGAILQVYIDAGSGFELAYQMSSHMARGTGTDSGWRLLNTPAANETLPGGNTANAFIEAGAEFDIGLSNTIFVPGVVCRGVGADTIMCAVTWPTIPKPNATGVTITLPGTSLIIKDATVATSALVTPTTSNLSIVGRTVSFNINETGAFSSLSAGDPYWMQIAGGGFKLTLT
jgi:hypothetical protein